MAAPVSDNKQSTLPPPGKTKDRQAQKLPDASKLAEDVLQTGGQPLDHDTRAFMEPKFGHNFGQVRVHADRRSEEAARSVNARAFTVGSDIVFGKNEYNPATAQGRQVLAHELSHTVQQGGAKTGLNKQAAPSQAAEAEAESAGRNILHAPGVRVGHSVGKGVLQRLPAAPAGIFQDRNKVNIGALTDMVTDPSITPQTATVTVTDPAAKSITWQLFDPSDTMIANLSSTPGNATSLTMPFKIDDTKLTPPIIEGRYTMRCIIRDSATALAYDDRPFYVWITKSATPRTPPDVDALKKRKADLDKVTKTGSGKSFGEVGRAFSQTADVEQDIGILQTGQGKYVGSKAPVQPPGTSKTDCTVIVLEILEKTFVQQGRKADWDKVKKKYGENQKLREGHLSADKHGLSGLDVQAALQSEAGWKGIYWAPDPTYKVPAAELSGVRSDEASYTSQLAKPKDAATPGKYYKGYLDENYPGVATHQRVINYAPEQPTDTVTHAASTTTKDTTMLDKLKKLPFGVFSTHGGFHMTLIMNGNVLEVHWSSGASDVDLIEESPLETWAVGPNSGFHYYASGVIVAPASDVDAAFAPTPATTP